MATYIPNVTDTFPQIQPFRPDYAFLQSALQYKQNKYDQGFNRLNSVYNSVINAPLTRAVDIERREAFLKAADSNLKKVTALDLSLPQNVQLASNIFKPFYEDKNIAYDMVYTRKAMAAREKGERLKDCLTEDCVGLYSPDSMAAIKYRLEEFAAADDETARTIPLPEYVPYANIADEAEKVLGEKFADIKIDEKSGGYIVTTKNGPKAFNVILQQLSSTVGVDPRVKKYAQTKAYVDDMNKILPLAQENYGGDIRLAKAEYYKTNADSIIKNDTAKKNLLEKSLDDVGSQIDIYNAKINNGKQLTAKETEEYNKLLKQKELFEKNANNVNERIRILNEALQEGNFKTLENTSLQSSAASYISDEILNASRIQAYKNYSRTLKADPYEEYSWKKKVDWSYFQLEEELKHRYKLKEKEDELSGGYDNFFPQTTTTEAGADPSKLYESDTRVINERSRAFYTDIATLAKSVYGINNPDITSALDKTIKAEGLSKDDVINGNLTSEKAKSLYDRMSNLFSKYDDLNKSLATPLKRANDSRQMMDAIDQSINKNNKIVFENMLRNTNISDEDKYYLKKMFTKEGALLDPETAYSNYVRAFNDPSLADKDDFMNYYEGLKEEFEENYIEFAQNNASYTSPVTPGLGGGGGITTDYTVGGIADPKRAKSPTIPALLQVTSGIGSAKVAIGSPAEVRKASGDNFEDIKENAIIRNYVSNLKRNMLMYKKPIAYSYSALGLGRSEYGTLHMSVMDDPVLKALKNSKQISEEEYSRILGSGITMIVPKSAIPNAMLNRRTSYNNKEIILRTTGKYNYKNPSIKADITYTLQDNGMVLPSGTIYDRKTNTVGIVPSKEMTIATFNSQIYQLDNY